MNKKKILFLDAYFEPEAIADTHLERDIIEGLVSRNCEINVICPIPTRSISEETRKKYSKIKHEELLNGSVKVTRFWAPQEKKNPIVRALRYIWCNVRTYQLAKKYIDTDVIYCNSTPPTQGFLAAKVKKNLDKRTGRNINFVFNLQDIFPDSLVNTGLGKKNGLFWKIGNFISDYTYKQATRIITITNRFKKNIVNKGVPAQKVNVISNWIDLNEVTPVKRTDNTLISEFNIDSEKFIVVYAGNFGASQGADIVLKTAKKLEANKGIQFVIFGGGSYFDDAKKEAQELSNVFIHELLPLDRVSEVYSLGNLSVIMCKPGTGGTGMPSKMWSILACGTPIIASFDMESDLSDAIMSSNCGICVEPGNVDALAGAILTCYENQSHKQYNAESLREYVRENADKVECVNKYCQTILGV